MMRWTLWDKTKGKPHSRAMRIAGTDEWIVLQQQVQVSTEKIFHENGEFSHFVAHSEWEDVPFHIESKK